MVTEVKLLQRLNSELIEIQTFKDAGNVTLFSIVQSLKVLPKLEQEFILVGNVMDSKLRQLANALTRLVIEFCAPGVQLTVFNDAQPLNV
jgi:hypothetical protein